MDESTHERLREPARLFADLYELTMLAAYGACGMDATATFSLFVRRLPTSRNFLLACGLDDLLSELETFRFSADDIAYLRSLDLLPESLFSGAVGFPLRRGRLRGAGGDADLSRRADPRDHGADR